MMITAETGSGQPGDRSLGWRSMSRPPGSEVGDLGKLAELNGWHRGDIRTALRPGCGGRAAQGAADGGDRYGPEVKEALRTHLGRDDGPTGKGWRRLMELAAVSLRCNGGSLTVAKDMLAAWQRYPALPQAI